METGRADNGPWRRSRKSKIYLYKVSNEFPLKAKKTNDRKTLRTEIVRGKSMKTDMCFSSFVSPKCVHGKYCKHIANGYNSWLT